VTDTRINVMSRVWQCLSLGVLAVMAMLVTVALAPAPARAQTAPSGNAPYADVPTASGTSEPVNPFGPAARSVFDLASKERFSKAVDLTPLRDLAVYHNGRVKILDTLSRETVATMLGRRDFVDFDVPAGGGYARKVHHDPLFTFLDVMIDPEYYLNRPLIHVEFLPLREAFLDRMYERDDEREWWKRVGRLKPLKLAEHLDAAESKYGFEEAYRRDLYKVRRAMELYAGKETSAWRTLQMVASSEPSKPWVHLSDASLPSEVKSAIAELGAAWRAGDAGKTSAAIRVIASELPKINPAMYPTTRRSLESAYNRVNAFEWGYWFYALALLTLLLAFSTGRQWLMVTGITTLALATTLHAFGFIARCVIAERFAIQNQFESMAGLSLFGATVGIVLMVVRKQPLFGAAAAGVGFMVLLTATQTAIPGQVVEREAPILNTSVLLKYHVTTVLVSYALIALGFMVALFYLGAHYAASLRGKLGKPAIERGPTALGVVPQAMAMSFGAATVANAGQAPDQASDQSVGTRRVLGELDKAHMIILQLAFWTLGVGILLGAWWADHSWGRWWAFDPKELWALVTWIVYLIVIHVRLTGLTDKGLKTAWLSVIGFIVMLWTYFGVNLLLPGLHAYA
jgi:cytochrome c-type biogenesis protein CcsB